MQAYRVYNLAIAADVAAEAREFYRQEIGGDPPETIAELSLELMVRCGSGETKTIRDRINEELDSRNSWLRMGVPCDLHWPFVIGSLD
ncbi:MAG TPA: hypothetical protein PK175_08735 [Syntrophales bacterium]|jgi:hypothetical protein|nr:hypothetical protein [Syntrophales bacterium]HOU76958.1 hypothetical protein [Syntrophales bacterium]HPC31727.1 hypothetical protein [Syntrophales bacterium]HQG34943.1 hypothetical protein [Syntrophales bacterium]HQI36858.1 hypothetical protein [Syntrophales bacterium]